MELIIDEPDNFDFIGFEEVECVIQTYKRFSMAITGNKQIENAYMRSVIEIAMIEALRESDQAGPWYGILRDHRRGLA